MLQLLLSKMAHLMTPTPDPSDVAVKQMCRSLNRTLGGLEGERVPRRPSAAVCKLWECCSIVRVLGSRGKKLDLPQSGPAVQ